jgi:apolipoprotein N-acyltransferase
LANRGDYGARCYRRGGRTAAGPFGALTLGNNWIATAFTYQAKMPAWLGGVAVFGLSLYLALFIALACALGWLFRHQPAARILGFAGAWVLAEWLRGWVLTGFPWNPLGAVLLGDFAHPALASLTPWLGTYGLSGLAILLAGVLAQGAAQALTANRTPSRTWGLALAAAPLALITATMLWPTPPEQRGTIAYTLVQPNIAQEDLDEPSHFEQQFVDSARLSRPLTPELQAHNDIIAARPPRLVLWPESGVPDYVRDGYPAWAYQNTFAGDPWMARLRLARVIGRGGLLLTGTVELDLKGEEAIGGQNVVATIDDNGRLGATYAKAHLVPLGEYLPARAWLKPLGLERLVPGDIDFRPGPGPRTLDLGALGKAGVQICYEIIFSGEVTDRAHRPDYIFNPSNDGWYGAWGPPQHLAQARLRAIEEGLPLLRSTTNGISAVVDAQGVVRAFAPLHVAQRIDGTVPRAALPTLYARLGHGLTLGLAIILLAAAALVLRRQAR